MLALLWLGQGVKRLDVGFGSGVCGWGLGGRGGGGLRWGLDLGQFLGLGLEWGVGIGFPTSARGNTLRTLEKRRDNNKGFTSV